MAGKIPNELRNKVAAQYREAICAHMGITPFPHQREWWLAAEGKTLLHGELAAEGDPWSTTVRLSEDVVERWKTAPRALGTARFLADLGAFKSGKSFSGGIWAAGFAIVPEARISLVGSEYDICAPEFDYICEALLSSRGMNLKAVSLQNRPRDGKMWLDLENGCRYEARSWERKESLKGKEIDAYVYCEAYQLPGIECFTGFKQNLNARKGYAVFATTPDRPWVKQLHEMGHGEDANWHCTCGVPQSVNPYTYDKSAEISDAKLMTKEKYQIHYFGQLGDFVGRVFNFQVGQKHFNASTHPHLFPDGKFTIPSDYEIVCGADTGTFYTALVVMFSPEGEAFVLDEYPNYKYISGQAERDEEVTIPQWSHTVLSGAQALGARGNFWADKNSQFKRELEAYGIYLLSSTFPRETRTEIAREYFQHNKVWLAPHLQILPFELENAAWPEEASLSGKFERVKDRDHTLDCLEHVLSRRPRGRVPTAAQPAKTWLEGYLRKQPKATKYGNSTLGAL